MIFYDVRLDEVVAKHNVLPCRVSEGDERVVGQAYWSGRDLKSYYVQKICPSYAIVYWEDGKVTKMRSKLDPVKDYKLYKIPKVDPPLIKQQPLPLEVIKAMCCHGDFPALCKQQLYDRWFSRKDVVDEQEKFIVIEKIRKEKRYFVLTRPRSRTSK